MVYYSALHYAAKAAKSAEAAADSATRASEASGKIVQVGFDGTLANGVLTFKHAPGGVEVPYNLQDGFEYELDLAFANTADLPTNTQMVIKNGNDTIRFVSALHREATTNATVADMDAVMRFNSSTGYRWLFKAAYKVTPSGAKVFLLYPVVVKEDTTKITNCITEIPQDIKLELNNGTLTLKAGSKVYVPNGAGKFDVVTVASDITFPAYSYSGQSLICVKGTRGEPVALNAQASGASNPGTKYSFWYDTTNNLVKFSTSQNGTFDAGGWSLPIALVARASGKYTSIDQVFNGFGYIGSTIFALPGVKDLIPNGRNADGSLRNIEFVINKVLTKEFTTANRTALQLVYHRSSNVITVNSPVNYEYNKEENYCYFNQEKTSAFGILATFDTDSSGKVSSFTPKLPFRAVDQNDFNKLDEETPKLNGNNLYTGNNEFKGIFKLLYQDGNEGAQIDWKTGNQSVIKDTVVKQDVVDHRMRFFAGNSTGAVMFPLTLNFETGLASTTTPPATDSSTNIATTVWVRHYAKNTGGANWAGKVSVAAATDYTAPSNGFIAYKCSVWNNTPKLTINGVELFSQNGNVIAGFFGSVPVCKGDVINISGDAGAVIYFIPLK